MAAGFSLYSTDSDDLVSPHMNDHVHSQTHYISVYNYLCIFTQWTLSSSDFVNSSWSGQMYISNTSSTELQETTRHALCTYHVIHMSPSIIIILLWYSTSTRPRPLSCIYNRGTSHSSQAASSFQDWSRYHSLSPILRCGWQKDDPKESRGRKKIDCSTETRKGHR